MTTFVPGSPVQYLSIGAVVADVQREFPDVSHSSLRFLEREGLLQPTRTPGGHRLYTVEDVQRIVQIKRWQAQRLTLVEIRRRLVEWRPQPDPDALVSSFLAAVLAGNLAQARREILLADEGGMALEDLFEQVLRPALTEIGRLWEEGTILVSQEKEISELVRDLIAELTLRTAPHQPDGATIVAAGVEGELHELGLRMVCGVLRKDGYVVHYLGANVAPGFMVEAARRYRPDAVLLSAKLESTWSSLRAAIVVLNESGDRDWRPMVIVGGAIAASRSTSLRELGAHPVEEVGLRGALRAIRAIVADSVDAHESGADAQ